MTIKELERRTGLPRTSIRFYEQEGLLTPERRENNYRDYSEDNVRTLEKGPGPGGGPGRPGAVRPGV